MQLQLLDRLASCYSCLAILKIDSKTTHLLQQKSLGSNVLLLADCFVLVLFLWGDWEGYKIGYGLGIIWGKDI